MGIQSDNGEVKKMIIGMRNGQFSRMDVGWDSGFPEPPKVPSGVLPFVMTQAQEWK